MSKYQRFQILSAGRQDLYLPESPVWVSRCQLSLDLESGKRLLQTRMVNCSERTVRQVFLRVVCYGADRQRLAQLELVPMERFSVLPGRVFGDDRLVELPVKGAVYAEAYAQRVRFSDDSAWDEPSRPDYLAFRAEPVRPTDPHYEALAERARSGGVRNDCYFRAQQGLWVCSCGLPNGSRALRCAHCGAGRLWLEQHMDRNLLDAPPAPRAAEPVTAAPAYPMPAPAVTVVPAPIHTAPAPQPTIIVQPAPEPEAEEAPVSHAGRNAAIVCGVLLALALGVLCAVKWLLPFLHYRQAMEARSAGDYDGAVAILRDLGDYRDSPEQVNETLARKAAQLMAAGEYQQALELYTAIGGHEDRIADCIYSLGVVAYNDGDPEKALDYVNQLRERFPDYENTEQLAQYCSYSLGNRAMEAAAGETEPLEAIHGYEAAEARFAEAGSYEDSDARAMECEYQIAKREIALGRLPEAAERLRTLADYKDADSLRLDTMMSYVLEHSDEYSYSAFLPSWLNELSEREYPGAAELLARLSGQGFNIELQYQDAEVFPDAAGDLSKIRIAYQVTATDQGEPVLVLVRYTLPDGRVGRGLLNPARNRQGSIGWTQIPFPADCTVSGAVELSFYDAELGESGVPLLSTDFQYVPGSDPEPEEPQTQPNPTQPPDQEEHTAPTGESSPATGNGD